MENTRMLARLKRILQAAVGDLLDRAGDPEMELGRFVGEVELALGDVRAEIVEADLRRGGLATRAADGRALAAEWMSKAEKAAARDEDDLAKDALRRRRDAEDAAASAEERLAEAELALATLRKDEAVLERTLRGARLEEKRLAARLRRAESERRAGAAVIGVSEQSDASERMRASIADNEAAGEADREVAGSSAENEFRSIEAPQSVDEELADLKRRIKGGR